MNKNFLATLSLAFIGVFTTQAQNVNQQGICGTDLVFQKAVAQNPALLQIQEDFYKTAATSQAPVEKAVRIIPVVFHVIHEGGTENISKEQIEDQIRILNEDYRRLNADATNTPSVWQSIAADANIEFRLANVDPQGNCTDGIVRIYSPLTNNASDQSGVKGLSYWNRQKYLNIWVVKTIDAMGNTSGVILGYAQLPIFGAAATDGVVLRSDVVGSIGSSLNGIDAGGKGRTATHEVGHWLGLRHIWGDSNCGDDGVADTPVHANANSGCPSFPKTNTCSGANVNGEMFMNYMDYTSGTCQNMFSAGQKSVFDLTLASVNYRATVISQSNLTATGVLNNPPNTCTPKAEFTVDELFICEGAHVDFTDQSWGGDPTQWDWQFPGGTPSSSTAQNPTGIVYNTPGTYNVTLTASNGQGNGTTTKQSYIHVSSNTADEQNSWNYTEPFEDQGYFDNKWIVVNTDNNNFKWSRTSNEGYSLSGAAKMSNYGSIADRVDELISPSFNFSSIYSPVLKFKLAYARTSNSANESLKVYLSSDCGKSWTQRYVKSATALTTTTNVGTSFSPNSNTQWRTETVSISSTFSNKPNVRIKFAFTSDANGNNLFIDDVNITSTTGIDQAIADNLNFNAFPNPSDGNVLVSYNLIAKARTDIRLYDVVGKEIKLVSQGNSFSGVNQLTLNTSDFPAPGIYLLQLMVDNNRFVKRLVITQ